MAQNMPPISEIERLHRKYAPDERAYELVLTHCKIVAEIAEWCAGQASESVDRELLRTAALLHDVGSYAFYNVNTPRLFGHKLYSQHGLLGAKLLSDEGLPDIATIVETHSLLGLTKQEIIDYPYPLPARDYVPTSIEGELLCYADRFHSKKPTFNDFNSFLAGLKQTLPHQAEKFEAMSKRFGVPDLAVLAKKYNQPIRTENTYARPSN